jgi:hypothetical protein
LIWKICHLELHHTEEVCANLSSEANKEIEEIVHTEVNNFQMKSQWISSGAFFIYIFGRKVIGCIFSLVSYTTFIQKQLAKIHLIWEYVINSWIQK